MIIDLFSIRINDQKPYVIEGFEEAKAFVFENIKRNVELDLNRLKFALEEHKITQSPDFNIDVFPQTTIHFALVEILKKKESFERIQVMEVPNKDN